MEKFYGLDFRYIYRQDLLDEYRKVHPYEICIWHQTPLDCDRLYHKDFELIYRTDRDAYQLVTPDPSNFLPHSAIFENWTDGRK